ncbi:MAG TPA: cysteine dioxygenase family protein, partial [bacterium]|nr:cysteine dioxygenase family protein [bacterium]
MTSLLPFPPSNHGAGPAFIGWAGRPGLPPALARELRALSRESDGELLGEGLFQIGRRALDRQQFELGREIISWLATEGRSRGIGASTLARAREELELLEGRGTFGRRAERFVGSFVRDATEPSALLGMSAGALAFSTFRFAALSRLAGSPGAYFWARGGGARALASTAAFLPEVTAFWGTQVLVDRAFHPERPLSSDWGREWLGAALSLGLLKLGGAGSSALFRRLHGIEAGVTARNGFTGLNASLFHQAGLLAGISLSQYLQPRLGLGASHGEHFWADAFASLLHFNVAGRLVGGQRFVRDLARREILFRQNPLPPAALSLPAWAPGLQPAVAVVGVAPGPTILMSQALRPLRPGSRSEIEPTSDSGVHRSPDPAPSLPPELQKPLEPLLLGLRQSVDDAALGRIFEDLRLDPEHWSPFVEFNPDHYNRRVLHREGEGPDSFEILLLSWKDGQGTVPHDHGGSSGFDRILQGQATEVSYRLRPDGALRRHGSARTW